MPGQKAKSITNAAAVLLNLVGAVTYLAISVPLWATPELAGIPGAGSGDPIVWGLTALPVLAFCFLLNIVWMIWGVTVFLVTRKSPIKVVHLFVPILWIIVVYTDFSHHWQV